MKRVIFCFAAAAALAACSKDNAVSPEGGDDRLVLNFDAGTQETEPDAVSRGGYDGTKSIWHAGDEVGLTFGSDNSNLHFTQEEGSLSDDGTRVRYTGTLNTPVGGTVNCVAYYPYASSASVTGQVVTTTFPAVQGYVAAGYKGIPLFAKYTGDYGTLGLQFKNLFSVVKLTLSKGSALSGTVNLQQIEFKGNNNETVSGAMVVDMGGSTFTVSYTGAGKTTTLDLGAGVELTTAPKTFYIAVPALDYTSGYTFTFITDKGQVSKSAKNSGASYAVNKVYAAPALTIDNLTATTVIPDGNLRNALQDLGVISILDPISGKVSVTSAGLTATSIDVSGKNIASLAGLDQFPALVTLKAADNDLVSADLSKLTLLTDLDLSGNRLSGLDLAANTALLSLDLASNQLSSLDLSANTLLTSLDVSSNALTSLDLAANVAMLGLDVSSNQLSSLDLSRNILLTSVKCFGNPLVTLDISGLKVLSSLNLVNGAESVDAVTKTLTIPAAATVQHLVSNGVALTNWLNFVCADNPNILSISLKNSTGLLTANVTGNTNLVSLDVSGNATMTGLTCNSNALTSLNVAGDTLLASLNASSNKLPSLDLSANTALLGLDVSSNLLTSLDLSKNILLTSVSCYGNNLVTLNISGLKALVTLRLLNASSNAVNTVAKSLTIPAAATVQNVVSNGVALSGWLSFICTGNPNVKTISLQNCVGLLHVTATNNTALTSLDVTGSALTSLGITQSGNASGFKVTGTVL